MNTMTVNHNHPRAGAVNPAKLLTKRAAYSPSEFAASCGRHPSWAYRLLYGGKVKALTDLGRILIPASELERVLAAATPYNPQPRKRKLQGPPAAKGVPGTPGIQALATNSRPARSERKCLRHATGGAA